MKEHKTFINQLKNRKMFFLVFSVLLVIGCKTTSATLSPPDNQNLTTALIPNREYSVQSVLWQQRSAEYKALCYQTFNLAKLQLDKILNEKTSSEKPLAIIADIDETLLDNSSYNAKMIETDLDFERESWIGWGKLEQANPIPGSVEFLQYAASKGVQVYYISNRYVIQQEETMANLRKVGFPFIDNQHILLKDKTSAKEERRQLVMATNTVVLLLGDNLSDFSEDFDKKSTIERNKTAESLKEKFGQEFIILPNPMYGDWESQGIYEGNYNWTPAQKDSIRKAKIISY